MRTTNPPPVLSYLIPSRVRREVLCSLLLDEREWHPREMARVLGLVNSAVARELAAMHEEGIAKRRRLGNQLQYSADPDCPVYAELRGLIVKTAGVADRVRAALAPLAGQIRCAYIYGSFADGRHRAGSDIDVMIIGDAAFDAVLDALHAVEAELRREVNPSVYGSAEYRQKLASGEGFIHHIHHGPKIMLIGATDELG